MQARHAKKRYEVELAKRAPRDSYVGVGAADIGFGLLRSYEPGIA